MIDLNLSTAAPASADADLIKDTTEATFMADVVEASQTVPVIVDFWAPWCDPCVEFTPTFEAAAKKNKDIIFGMVDIEKDKEIADYFQIKVIPGLLVIRERAGIFAHDDGEVSAKAFDEIITWAREYDMSTVKDYYKREGSGQIN